MNLRKVCMMVTEELRKDGYRNVGPIVNGDVGTYVLLPSGGEASADLELKVLDSSIEFKISSPISTFVPAYSAIGNCQKDGGNRIGLQIIRGVNNFFFGRALYKALFALYVPAERPPEENIDKLVWTIAGKTVTIDLSDPNRAEADFDGGDKFRIPRDAQSAANALAQKLCGAPRPSGLHSILDRLDKIARNS